MSERTKNEIFEEQYPGVLAQVERERKIELTLDDPLGLLQRVVDLNLFWERIFMVTMLTRLMLCFDIASDRKLSREVFGADSHSERLALVKHLLTLQTVEASNLVVTQ